MHRCSVGIELLVSVYAGDTYERWTTDAHGVQISGASRAKATLDALEGVVPRTYTQTQGCTVTNT